jgi:L-threonylcarbamoyladenylate synthase
MASEILTIDTTHPQPEVSARAVEVLNNGGVIVAPTETRYGLLARVDSPRAVERVYTLKNRAPEFATAVFVHGGEELRQLAELNDTAEALVRAFLPGPLTLVLSATVAWSAPLVVNGKIGVRWSASPVITALLKGVPSPLTATSANLSGKEEPPAVSKIRKILGGEVALYLDGGTRSGPPSTVVDCTSPQPLVLRQGPITEAMLRQAVGKVGAA